MTLAAWSKERQINRFTLQNWVEEFRREAKPTAGTAQRREWLEVSVNTAKDNIVVLNEELPRSSTYTPIRISIGNAQIEVISGFDETALSAVIKAVSYQC